MSDAVQNEGNAAPEKSGPRPVQIILIGAAALAFAALIAYQIFGCTGCYG